MRLLSTLRKPITRSNRPTKRAQHPSILTNNTPLVVKVDIWHVARSLLLGLPSERLLCNVTTCRDAVTPMTLPVPNPIVPAKPNRWMHITTVWIATHKPHAESVSVWYPKPWAARV